MEALTDQDRALLKGTNFGHLATLMEDGTPHVAPMWVDCDEDGYVLINTHPGRVKDLNVRRDPRVALSVEDSDDPYSWVAIRGRVVEFVEGEPAWAHINELSQRYNDQPYPVKQSRVIYRIAPDHISRPNW